MRDNVTTQTTTSLLRPQNPTSNQALVSQVRLEIEGRVRLRLRHRPRLRRVPLGKARSADCR